MDVIADGSEERISPQNIRFVAHSDAPLTVKRCTVPFARKIEGESRYALGAVARDDQRVRRDLAAQHHTTATTGVQTFRVFPDNDVVDAARLAGLQRRKIALVQIDGPDIREQIEPEAQPQVKVIADLSPIRIGHSRHTGSAMQNRVSAPTGVIGFIGKYLPGAHIVTGTAWHVRKGQQTRRARVCQDSDG